MSEHAVAQTQKANTPQETTKDVISLQRRPLNPLESTIMQEWLFDTASGTFTEPRFGYDFSRVPAHSDMVQQTLPLLRTRTMVQRFPKNGTAGSAPCPACTDEESTPISAPAEPAAETTESSPMVASSAAPAEPMTEPVSPEAETAPTPAEPTTEPAEPTETAASGLIVEDTTTDLAPGQMKKSEFLSQLRVEVCQTVEAAIAETGRTTDDCPYLNHWFDFYGRQNSARIERTIHRYAPEASNATTAVGYISIITQRAHQAAETWARTGEIMGVPEGVPITMPGASGGNGGGSATASTGPVMFKAREGGVRAVDDPRAVQAQLGQGRPLESGVRSRMESAFGMDFSHVRTHTDSTAAGLCTRFNACAFTVGKHVAFGANKYKSGTLVGDAIIAHELVHVVQQSGGEESVAPKYGGDASYNRLEDDADKSAMGAVASLWGKTKDAFSNIAENAIPSLRSGLRLQRCKESTQRQPRSISTQQSKCQVQKSLLDMKGGTVTESRKSRQYLIQAGDGTINNMGMFFVGGAKFNPPKCGELLYVQNVKSLREFVYKDKSRCIHEAKSWHLDTSDPYPSESFPSPSPDISARITNDSPGQGSGRIGDLSFTEGLINTMTIRDEFRMFLLFRPKSGTRQTIHLGTWNFVAQANNTTAVMGKGTLKLDTNSSKVTPATGKGSPSSKTPVVSPNITSVKFRVDRAGGSKGKTFADLFVKILSRSP